MYPFSFALFIGFILIIVESYIVMAIKNESTIYLGGLKPFLTIWAMNFFLTYAIMMQIKHWYINREVE